MTLFLNTYTSMPISMNIKKFPKHEENEEK